MQRAAVQVLEQVEVVSQLSMEPLACMTRGFGVDVHETFVQLVACVSETAVLSISEEVLYGRV